MLQALVDVRERGVVVDGVAGREINGVGGRLAEVAATPMAGWGPSGERYLRLVFANEPAERLGDLRARFDAAFG